MQHTPNNETRTPNNETRTPNNASPPAYGPLVRCIQLSLDVFCPVDVCGNSAKLRLKSY
jgi:hypothetical protein